MQLFRQTFVALKRAKGYNNRVMVYAHRRNKARYLPPNTPYVKSPLANKAPEEYQNNWDSRSGDEWYNRLRQRGAYRHWPWAKWTDDPIRFHADPTCRRTLSVKHQSSSVGLPLWDYYAEVGREYRTPSDAPLHMAVPFIHPYVATVWKRDTLDGYVARVSSLTGLRTIEEVAAQSSALLRWADGRQAEMFLCHSAAVAKSEEVPSAAGETREGCREIPKGFIQHLVLLCRDVVQKNDKIRYREVQHQNRGVLRTREMERYYALPYLSSPAMPVNLAQPSGEYPWGKYTMMNEDSPLRIDPLQKPDGWFKDKIFPV